MIRISLRLLSAVLSTAPLAYALSAELPPAPVSPHTAVVNAYGGTPLSFEPNQGQADQAVKFLARGDGYTTFLQPNTATLLLSRLERGEDGAKASTRNGKAGAESNEVLRMRLIGGAKDAPMRGERPLPGYVNYLSGTERSRWSVGLPTFGATAVEGVYPGGHTPPPRRAGEITRFSLGWREPDRRKLRRAACLPHTP